MQDRLFDIWASLRIGIADCEFMDILDMYDTTYQLFKASEEELSHLPCSPELQKAFADKYLDDAYRIKSYCEKRGIQILFWKDETYPSCLRELKDPPAILYVMGRIPDFDSELALGIVGTRTMSEYGKHMAYKIGHELAAGNILLVSGMALGIDGVAMAAALAAGGHPVAVLGGGVDIIYPYGHRALYEALVRKGTIMSEFPPGTAPEGHNFPVRNRLISGLTAGTIVVEADEKSGALITARTAIMQGRDIFAVPGNVGEQNSSGTNRLIQDGARVATSGRGIAECYIGNPKDRIDWVKLTLAEARSEPNDAVLQHYNIQVRTISSREPSVRREGYNCPMQPPAPSSSEQRESRPFVGVDRHEGGSGQERLRDKRPRPAPRPQPRADDRTPVTDSDRSGQALASLTEVQKAVFLAMPLDHAVSPDALVLEGISTGDTMAALTVLEIKGLIISLPGGLYARR